MFDADLNPSPPKGIVEICVEGLSSALAAGEGGADRIELCENLAVGGVTPSVGAIAVACARLPIPVHVLIRPRGGDFVYSAAEVDAMRQDIQVARDHGASGVVLGALTDDGQIDQALIENLIDLARPMSVTFHRAFDRVPDPFAALFVLNTLGIDRILTSGQAATARQGAATLGHLARHAWGGITVLAGGKVAPQDLPRLVGVGLTEVHAGSAVIRNGVTDPDLVRQFMTAAREAFATPPRRPTGPIWHLISRAAWDEAVASGQPYLAPSLATEGFIHTSEADEMAESANRFYRGCPDLVALQIDPARVNVPIVAEFAPDRNAWFPHLFGPLDPAAVVAITPVPCGQAGRFTWP